jgi:hypothetical protein
MKRNSLKALALALLVSSLLVPGARAQNSDQKYICWKVTYGRGVGTIPTNCASDQDKDAGLCYPKCKAGYRGVGPVCWSDCPAGFRDDGAFCAKPAPYGRGAGYAIWDEQKCRNEHGGNCEKSGAMWYPTCATNFHAVGCCICSPDCPSGMTDIGVSCSKVSSGRGVGQIPSCTSGQQTDAGLCYDACAPAYDGVGPVCWGKCTGDYPFACGAGCARSQAACAAATTEQVTDVASFALFFLTLPAPGVSTAFEEAANAGRQAITKAASRGAIKTLDALPTFAKAAAKAGAKDFAKTFVKSYLKSQVFDPRNAFSKAFAVTKFAGLQAANDLAQEAGSMKQEGQFDYSILTSVDPTGFASMVYAFAQYGSCTVEDLAPNVMDVDFGATPVTGKEVKTIELTVQNPTAITEITTTPLEGCSINPEAECVGKTLQPGQKCTVKIEAQGQSKILGEVRVYTTAYSAVPMAFEVKANDGAAHECPVVPGADEAVNLSSVAGVWAWNDDQAHKVTINYDGSVQSWTGTGRAEVVDPIKRTFNVSFGSNSTTVTLSPEHEGITFAGGTATKRPWDPRCNPGETFFAGLCYDVPVGYAPTAPGFMGKPCPADWRDDGTQCYPPWNGLKVDYQADAAGTFTMRHPILVTDCSKYSQVNHQICPANFKNTAVCTCEAQPTSKEVKSIIGHMPK